MFDLKQIYLTHLRALSALALMIALIAATSTAFVPPVKAAGTLSPTSSLTPEQIEAAVEEYFDAVSAHDVQRYVNTFAPDGVLEDPVGTPPLQGTAAITGFITNIIAPFSDIKHRIQDVVVCGNEAAVNWKLDLKTTTNKHITIDGMGIFRFNQDGKLESVREFWDLAAFLADLQG
jgi:steroid Delta-isomerase